MKIRPISSTLQNIAEEELNEVPSRVPEDIAHIQKWLAQQPHLHKINPDDQLILNFLRGCKFSLQKTKMKLDMMYTMKSLLPEFYSNRDPLQSQIQDILTSGVWLPLSKLGDERPTSVLVRISAIDPEKMKFTETMKVATMIADILLYDDDNFSISKANLITDLQGMSFKHLSGFNVNAARKAAVCLEQAYPVRIKGFHHINGPALMESFINIIKPLTPEKLRNRIFVYSEKNANDFYNDIPSSLLPKEYGGNGLSLDELTAYWKTEVERRREWFLENEKIYSDETKRIGSPTITENIFGVEGSFRKLAID